MRPPTILRGADVDGDGIYTGTPDAASYQLGDSTFSVAAQVDATSGKVRQRNSYDSYGKLRVMLPADFDGDGTVTVADHTAFGTALEEESPAADFNGDGSVTVTDMDEFHAWWLAARLGTDTGEVVRIGYGG